MRLQPTRRDRYAAALFAAMAVGLGALAVAGASLALGIAATATASLALLALRGYPVDRNW